MFSPPMMGTLVKQFLMAAGVRDPKAMQMVDALVSGGFETPVVETYAGESLPIREGTDTILISTFNTTDEMSFVLMRRKK